jgi:hypothetical protein
MRRLGWWCALIGVLAGCAPSVVWEGRTPDRQAWVKIVEDRRGQRVVVGDRAGRSYGGIGVEELTYSADGRRLAYPARVGEHWTIVLDGRELGRWTGVGELRFSPDGSRLAFAAERDGRWCVVVDEKPGPALDAIFAGTLRFSENGRALAYVGSKHGQGHVVFDQRPDPGFDGIGRLVVGAQGRRLLYAGRRADGWHVVDGDNVGPGFAAIVELAMSPNEQHVAYVWRTEPDEGLVVDGEAAPPYRLGMVSSLFVDDAGRLTFVATRDGASRVVRQGTAERLFDQITKLVVTRAGRSAYLGRVGRKLFALVDGVVSVTADAIEDLVPSPDGRRFAFLVRRGEQWLVAQDGREFPYDKVVAGSLAWSRDSRHWGVLAGDAKSRQIFISVDGARRRPFDMRELVLLAEKRPGASPEAAARALQALIAAELETATRE